MSVSGIGVLESCGTYNRYVSSAGHRSREQGHRGNPHRHCSQDSQCGQTPLLSSSPNLLRSLGRSRRRASHVPGSCRVWPAYGSAPPLIAHAPHQRRRRLWRMRPPQLGHWRRQDRSRRLTARMSWHEDAQRRAGRAKVLTPVTRATPAV